MSFEEQMEEVENWTSGTNIPPSLSQQCGLSTEQFPPAEMLADEEINEVMSAFQEMLSTLNLQADFPSRLL